MWEAIARIGRDGRSGGCRRFAWTSEDAVLREWFAGEAAARGLDLVTDRAGNQWAWWGDPDGRPGVVAGSHLDSVPDGGAFDGPLGVVSAFAALDALRERGFGPARPIAVAHFGDEEGARFGVACAGSRLLDARGVDGERVQAVLADLTDVVTGHGGTVTEESWSGPVTFDGSLAARLAALLGGAPVLDTGAGHDAGILAAHGIPTAMLFVRNPTGVSHSPAEHAEPADCAPGWRRWRPCWRT